MMKKSCFMTWGHEHDHELWWGGIAVEDQEREHQANTIKNCRNPIHRGE